MMERTQLFSDSRAMEEFDCPICRLGHVRRLGVFEHTACGFVDVAARFDGVGTQLGCPKCDATLSVTDDELHCVTFLFCCSGCNRRFDTDVSFASRMPQRIEGS